MQSKLNKICPENLQTIVEQLAGLRIQDLQELELLIGLVFRKALTELHYCETYADLVYRLKSELPECPVPGGGKTSDLQGLPPERRAGRDRGALAVPRAHTE